MVKTVRGSKKARKGPHRRSQVTRPLAVEAVCYKVLNIAAFQALKRSAQEPPGSASRKASALAVRASKRRETGFEEL